MSIVTQNVLGTMKVAYQDEEIDLSPGWTRITMIDAIKQYTGLDFFVISTDEEAQVAAKKSVLK